MFNGQWIVITDYCNDRQGRLRVNKFIRVNGGKS